MDRWEEDGEDGERVSKGVGLGAQTCQGCHAMPAPDWAPAGGR